MDYKKCRLFIGYARNTISNIDMLQNVIYGTFFACVIMWMQVMDMHKERI